MQKAGYGGGGSRCQLGLAPSRMLLVWFPVLLEHDDFVRAVRHAERERIDLPDGIPAGRDRGL